MLPDYTEPSWLFDPPEDTRQVVTYCDNCNEPVKEGDPVYSCKSDESLTFCSEDCFEESQMIQREASLL